MHCLSAGRRCSSWSTRMRFSRRKSAPVPWVWERRCRVLGLPSVPGWCPSHCRAWGSAPPCISPRQSPLWAWPSPGGWHRKPTPAALPMQPRWMTPHHKKRVCRDRWQNVICCNLDKKGRIAALYSFTRFSTSLRRFLNELGVSPYCLRNQAIRCEASAKPVAVAMALMLLLESAISLRACSRRIRRQ